MYACVFVYLHRPVLVSVFNPRTSKGGGEGQIGPLRIFLPKI